MVPQLVHLPLCALVLASTLLLWRKYGPLIASTIHSEIKEQERTPNSTKLSVDGATGVKHIYDYPPPRTEYIEESKGIIRTHNLVSLTRGSSKTPTGFSSEDISGLGDFPDYARLSGIPLPKPDFTFNITKSLCRPYRPFRWPHHQTMSLHKFEADYWVELDKDYVRNIRKRQALYEKYGKAVLDAMPGSEIACKELMEMVLQFLCSRYPQWFALELSESRQAFINRILETTTDLLCTPPLVVLLNNVPEDYTIMIRNDYDGQYYLRAAIVMTSIGWSVATKIGRPLDEIHEHVPLYKEKMRLSMNKYFAKLPTDRAMQRGSWTLTPGKLLFIPPGDPILQRVPSQDPDLAIEDIYYRLDRQVVRRLPVSGAVIFSFRVLFTPLETFREEPYIPKLCLTFLEDHIPELQKATYPVEHKAIPLLKQWHQEQVERKLVPANWEIGTLEEAPFFPGWKEMYLKEQQ